jgi:hypothetical protein
LCGAAIEQAAVEESETPGNAAGLGSSSRWWFVVVGGLAMLVALFYFVQLSRSEGRSIEGTIQLNSDEDGVSRVSLEGDCEGDGGYSDLTAGAQVTVKDESGKVIGTGNLRPGTASSIDPSGDKTAESLGTTLAVLRTVSAGLGIQSRACEFEFTIEDVPRVDFYNLSIGRRDGPTYTFEEMERNGWEVALSIGD